MIRTLLTRYMDALNAEKYTVQLTHPVGKPVRLTLNRSGLLKTAKYLLHKNACGYNIYARPVGYGYVLLDDLKRDVLTELAKLKPCLLLETSPGNYQAWVILPVAPGSREQAVSICQELAQRFAADPGSAEPDHIGRLPGFTNRKEQYRNGQGLYPFVKLHGAEHRISLYTPKGGLCEIKRESKAKTVGHDRSRSDFRFVCGLIFQRKPDELIAEALRLSSEKARQRGDEYINRTIINARRITGITE